MLISMTVASNTELSEDQAAHSRLLFNLYNRSDGDLSEIQRTRLPKLHSLTTCS